MAHAQVRAHYFHVVASIFIQINLHRESSESQQAGTLRSGLPDSSHSKKSLRLKFMYDWSSLKAGSLDKRTTAVACKDTKETQTINTEDLSHKTSAIHSTIFHNIRTYKMKQWKSCLKGFIAHWLRHQILVEIMML